MNGVSVLAPLCLHRAAEYSNDAGNEGTSIRVMPEWGRHKRPRCERESYGQIHLDQVCLYVLVVPCYPHRAIVDTSESQESRARESPRSYPSIVVCEARHGHRVATALSHPCEHTVPCTGYAREVLT
jgi:hypothetical protein